MNSKPAHHAETAIECAIASEAGRFARFTAGLTIAAFGLTVLPKPLGLAVAGFGLLPIITGVFNLCPIAPLWGGHIHGSDYRHKQAEGEDPPDPDN